MTPCPPLGSGLTSLPHCLRLPMAGSSDASTYRSGLILTETRSNPDCNPERCCQDSSGSRLQKCCPFSLTPSPPLPPYASSFLPLSLFLSLFCCRMLLTRVENMTDDSSQYLTAPDARDCLFFLIFSTPKILGKDLDFADLCQVLTPRKIMHD